MIHCRLVLPISTFIGLSSSLLADAFVRITTTRHTYSHARVVNHESVYTSRHHYQPTYLIKRANFPLAVTEENTKQGITELNPDQCDFFASLDPEVYGMAFIERLRDLQAFKNEHGSCVVPKRYSTNPTLGNWVNKMRQMYRKFNNGEKSTLNQSRIDVLDDMGFIWVAGDLKGNDGNKNQWMEKYYELKNYIVKDNVEKLSSHKSLYSWIIRQRREYVKYEMDGKTSLTGEQVRLLESIGFDWSPYETKWNLRLKELEEYQHKFGDCLVPINYEENKPLARWVSTQRKNFKSGSITEVRIDQLNKLGFVWDLREHNMKKWID